MSDKDQFTFADDDDFPELKPGDRNKSQESDMSDTDHYPGTSLDDQDESQELDLSDDDDFPEMDLSAAFAEGEHSAEGLAQSESELKIISSGNSRVRILLMVLLLVAVVGGGAYYFMDLGGTTPSVPSVPAPAQTSTKSVALPPQPAAAPVAQAKAESEARSVSVTLPPPPPTVEPVVQVAPANQPDTAVNTAAIPVATTEDKATAEKPKEEPVIQPATQVVMPVPQAQVVATDVATAAAVSPTMEPAKPVVPPVQVADGAFVLDAGSYLLEANRDSLVAKIKKLGYEPVVTPVEATLDMTRLRLGTYGKDEVQKALDFARTIEPGSYSTPAGDRYVIYAGTFLKTNNIDKLSQRFQEEGIKVHPEPVQVVRTLSRILFGSFTTKEDAAAAAKEVAAAGLKAAVVKVK